MKHLLLATTALAALASPAFALSGTAPIVQQNTAPVPNPDGYSAAQLLKLPPSALGAGATAGGWLIQPVLPQPNPGVFLGGV